MKKIALSQGKFALVDDDDYALVMQLKWFVTVHPNGRCAVWCHMPDDWYWPTRTERMARFITGARPGQDVDHINHDGLDNRRCNLRVCSRSQNMMNAQLRQDNTTGHKGIRFQKRGRGWAAHIKVNYQQIHLGTFPTKEEAIQARKDAASVLFGEYAFE